MIQKAKPRVIACSVLQAELEKLVEQGDLDVDLVFVSKYFHVDFSLLEENLRPVIQENLPTTPAGIVLVYGDLCLGTNGEMKKLAEEYGLVKVDAHNCVDCLLGGKGKISEVDPNHDLMVFSPGMVEFFEGVRQKAREEGFDESVLKQLFCGLKGIVLLDTLHQAEENRAEIEKMDTGIPILENRFVGLENLKKVMLEALEKNQKRFCSSDKGC
jgi:hypothetical protein